MAMGDDALVLWHVASSCSYLRLVEPRMDLNKGAHNGYYYSLTMSMLLVIMLVAIMPMIVVSSIILYEFDISYHEKVHAHLEELVFKHKHNIRRLLETEIRRHPFMGRGLCQTGTTTGRKRLKSFL